MNYGWRAGVVLALIVAMAVALAGLMFRNSDAATADTTLTPTTTSLPTTTTSTPTSTTTAATTTTISPDARIAEVELIMEDLYLRWYDAIYREDASALPDIVALQRDYDSAVEIMGTVEFIASPTEAGVSVTVLEILEDRPDCLVVHYDISVSSILDAGRPAEKAVHVLWPRGEGGPWRLARLWSGPGDLWNVDCDLTDRTEIP